MEARAKTPEEKPEGFYLEVTLYSRGRAFFLFSFFMICSDISCSEAIRPFSTMELDGTCWEQFHVGTILFLYHHTGRRVHLRMEAALNKQYTNPDITKRGMFATFVHCSKIKPKHLFCAGTIIRVCTEVTEQQNCGTEFQC